MAKSKAKKDEENIFDALALLEKEMNIPSDYMIEKITNAIRIALKKSNNGNDDIQIRIEPENRVFSVFIRKTVVEQVNDSGREVLLETALKYDPFAEIGSVVALKQDPKQFGRIAAQTAKHIIHQGIRDVEKGQVAVRLNGGLLSSNGFRAFAVFYNSFTSSVVKVHASIYGNAIYIVINAIHF